MQALRLLAIYGFIYARSASPFGLWLLRKFTFYCSLFET
jgi:hypothetical protein